MKYLYQNRQKYRLSKAQKYLAEERSTGVTPKYEDQER